MSLSPVPFPLCRSDQIRSDQIRVLSLCAFFSAFAACHPNLRGPANDHGRQRSDASAQRGATCGGIVSRASPRGSEPGSSGRQAHGWACSQGIHAVGHPQAQVAAAHHQATHPQGCWHLGATACAVQRTDAPTAEGRAGSSHARGPGAVSAVAPVAERPRSAAGHRGQPRAAELEEGASRTTGRGRAVSAVAPVPEQSQAASAAAAAAERG